MVLYYLVLMGNLRVSHQPIFYKKVYSGVPQQIKEAPLFKRLLPLFLLALCQ